MARDVERREPNSRRGNLVLVLWAVGVLAAALIAALMFSV